ncbi:Uncharacterised protein [Vibrio cholerae]|nr:Uncharacterised protein [Vibrio cholerae]
MGDKSMIGNGNRALCWTIQIDHRLLGGLLPLFG